MASDAPKYGTVKRNAELLPVKGLGIGMALISFPFFCLLLITALLFYLCPKRWRFLVLIAASGYYYFVSEGAGWSLVLLAYIALFFGSALLLKRYEQTKTVKNAVYAVTITAALGALLFLKYWNPLGLHSPLGMSFWMLTGIGYVTDVYRGSVRGAVSPAKTTLLLGFFPLMISGPILRYGETAKELVPGADASGEPGPDGSAGSAVHKSDTRQIAFGAQRILWGCMKKLVLSQRLAVIVDTVYANVGVYQGWTILFAVCCFSLQLYTDFSGCMDIVLGAAELFGIRLPENFQTPFLAENVSEFWRRWHITLGAWLKDYVLYPLLHSEPFRRLKKIAKKRLGKVWGERIVLYMGMFVSWFLIGLWHGSSWKYIFGVGVWFWAVIVAGELWSPAVVRLAKRLHINMECFSFRLFQRLRTFALVAFGLSFFRAASAKEGVKLWTEAFACFNPHVLFGSSLLKLGLDLQDMLVLASGMLVLLFVSLMQYRGVAVRERLAGQNLVFRWGLYLVLFFTVIIFGVYGKEYNAADFIYQGF
ncbi:MAG: MBOAT family protein [Lachnospiraceae bacterium]|nr:MBOAT family protein [Lachnospiraceae bacterium]